MNEENIDPEPGSREQEATDKNSDGIEGGSTPKSSNEDMASPWVPGIVEVEFKADVAPEIITNEGEDRFEIKSLAGRSLSKFNQLIEEHGLVRAALTFETPREKALNLQEIALQQGFEVPSLSNF